jgi:hypothetical protein
VASARVGALPDAEMEGSGLADQVLDHRTDDTSRRGSRALVPTRWQTPTRAAWAVLVLLTVALFVAGFSRRSALLLVVVPSYAPGLARLGLSVTGFRTAVSGLELLSMLVFSAVGILMFWRRSDEWVALVASLGLIATGAMPTFLRFGARVPGMWDRPSTLLLALGTALSICTLFMFPNGHFFPRWTVVPAILACAWAATWPFVTTLNAYNWPSEVGDPVLSVFYGSAAAVLIYRYRRTVDPQQRLQLKWVLYSFVVIVLVWIFAGTPRYSLQALLSRPQYSLLSLVTGVAILLGQMLLPLSLAVAILRYRLWEIDMIIDRTLVYVPLTGILAGVYAASIALLQRGFQAFSGAKSDAAIVLTTLLLVGVFSPVKDALQHLVERRYREPNDPMAPLRAFGQHVRSVADVFDARRMTEQALHTAAAALGARGGALYLERNGESRLVHAYGEWTAGQVALDLPLDEQGVRLGCLQLAARRDGKSYSARDCDILRETLAEVAHVIYLVETGDRFPDD